MAQTDFAYRRLVQQVLIDGEYRESRAGRTLGIFGPSIVVPNTTAFPMLTTRRLYPKGVVGELAAFLTGSTQLSTFKDFGCNYWDHNAAAWLPNEGKPVEEQEVGRIYGTQWREWNGVYDQLEALVKGIKMDPYGRRHLLSTWNPSDLHNMCLPPCHLLAQFYVVNGLLLCLVYMRSVDLALGLPSDLILYGLLQRLVARECNLVSGPLQFTFGDAHIYEDHIDDLKEQSMRNTRLPACDIVLAEESSLFNFHPSHVEFINYEPAEPISYAFHV